MPDHAPTRFGRRLWLITVAVGRYADPVLMPDLPGVPKDANRLGDVLRQKSALPLADAVQLFNEQATREAILDALRTVAREALASDQAVILFAGHGHERLGGDSPMPDGMTRYLLPFDATWDTVETQGISTRQLGEALSRLRASEVVVLLDCCHGGGHTPVFGQQLARLLQAAKSRYVLAAARHPQLALDTDGGSPLTQGFCDALQGLVPGVGAEDGAVSATAAGEHARKRVKAEAAPWNHGQEAVAFEIGDAIALSRVTAASKATGKAWVPRVCYPLQPAPHFQGREKLRSELLAWARSRESPDRVVSLVAVGGTGKTALAERVQGDMGEQAPAGLLVWSFYEDPGTEGFQRTACEYFTGEATASTAGLLERLQTALTGDEPHLLILDGLERVQAEGTTGRPRGGVEDVPLRRLLRWLAAGRGTRTRALVTSRFPLVDLQDWAGRGYREERLEDLEPAAARAVLRGWGVKGDDAALDRLASAVHCHALSVAVLGSYLGKLWAGDPRKAPEFKREEEADADPKAARLNRILMHYAQRLSGAERDLLARLSAFPRSVTVELLAFLVDAGSAVAGAVHGCTPAGLVRLLGRLRDLGLVFRYETPQGTAFSAHPFLRDYFRELLAGTSPQELHETVRARLANGLESRPTSRRSTPELLDRYEALVEHTRLAGRTKEALELFLERLGSWDHVGRGLGEPARGLRIVSGFSADGSPEGTAPQLSDADRKRLVSAWAGFAGQLGDLVTARRALALSIDLEREDEDARGLSRELQRLADLELAAGRNPLALGAATSALGEAERARETAEIVNSHLLIGAALGRLGRLGDASRRFAEADEAGYGPLSYSVHSLREAEFRLATGNRLWAARRTLESRGVAQHHHWADAVAACETMIGLLVLTQDHAVAREHLAAAREYASRAGDVGVRLRCSRLAAETARAERDFRLARVEAEAGIQLGDECDFGQASVELRLTLACVHLDAGDPGAALRRAQEALERSAQPECQYAWGEADALHLLGVAHARLGDGGQARQCLSAALAKRGQLAHPGLAETRAELERLGA